MIASASGPHYEATGDGRILVSGASGDPGTREGTQGQPFTKQWTYRLDGGNELQFGGWDYEGNIVVASSITEMLGYADVIKFNGSENPADGSAPDPVWSLQGEWFSEVGDVNRNLDGFAIDSKGDIYIASFNDQSSAILVKISSEGFTQWTRTYDSSFGDLFDIVIDEEDIPYIVLNNVGTTRVFQINPLTGATIWSTRLNDGTNCATSAYLPRIETDGRGGIYVWAGAGNTDNSFLMRLDGGNGSFDWCIPLIDLQCVNYEPNSIVADGEGGVVIVGNDSGGGGDTNGVARRYDIDGNLLWTYSYPGGNDFDTHFGVVKRTRSGGFVIGGSFWNEGFFGDAGAIFSIDEDGHTRWINTASDGQPAGSTSPIYRERIHDIEFDQVGNVYAMTHHFFNDSGTIRQNYSVTKLEESTGSVLWQDYEQVDLPWYDFIQPKDLVVDGGGNVFAISAPRNGIYGKGHRVVKYTQQYIGSPQPIQRAYVNLTFENRSIWTPGAGQIVEDAHLFSTDWDDIGVHIDEGFTVPLIGEFSGEFDLRSSGILYAGVRAEVNGGSADLHMPFSIEMDIPPITKVNPGKPVTIDVDWKVDPSARLTSNFTPTFNAGLTAAIDYTNYGYVQVTVADNQLVTEPVFLDDSDSYPSDYIPELNLLDLLAQAGAPVPGEWASFNSGSIESQFRTPQILAEGRYDPGTGLFSTDATDRFFMMDVNVTEAILQIFGATAQAEIGFGNDSFGVSGSGELLQFRIGTDLAVRQQIDVGLEPRVRYEFSHGVPTQTIPISQDLTFVLPSSFDGSIEIKPTILAQASFMNNTDVQVIPGLSWKTLEAQATAWAFGFDVFSLGPYCLFCYDWDLSEILEALQVDDPTIVNADIDVFDDVWQIDVGEIELPSFRIAGETSNLPQLASSSRSQLRMIIYDQTSPTPTSFESAAGGVTKMLLYGNRLFDGVSPNDDDDATARIDYWGRDEALVTTRINNNTLLVEIPDRFRLIPGIAKLYVETRFGTSESIDLPIVYPVPRLDAVNPNLWAADPGLSDVPISVIDAKTFMGNDTYIARRDYYIKMRNELWSTNIAGGFAGGAAAYFPDFDFNQLPGFPAVLWGGSDTGTPLPRFVQPVDNGIHNVRISEDLYDRAQTVRVAIRNPGPGGGESNELVLTIAAPKPVASRVEPSDFSPVDVVYDDNYFDPNDTPVARPIKLKISGPSNVPVFTGYEEPKNGNFNADSVVRFNGVDLATDFVNSSMLIALLPPTMATLGDHAITVHTPSNGTVYNEELRTDSDFDGNPDTVVFQGTVPSGGDSAPLLFRVAYRPPVIATLSPPGAELNSSAFTDPPANKSPYNITISGEDFRDGATVYFDGQPRATEFVTPTKLRATLLPQDVSRVGSFELSVVNPGPDFQIGYARFEVEFNGQIPGSQFGDPNRVRNVHGRQRP
jgi:hypothetical protein